MNVQHSTPGRLRGTRASAAASLGSRCAGSASLSCCSSAGRSRAVHLAPSLRVRCLLEDPSRDGSSANGTMSTKPSYRLKYTGLHWPRRNRFTSGAHLSASAEHGSRGPRSQPAASQPLIQQSQHMQDALHALKGGSVGALGAGDGSSMSTSGAATTSSNACGAGGPANASDDILELNVSGRIMQTTRSTLQQVPGSRLWELFKRDNDAALARDAAGRVVLDLDPSAFQRILKHLRELKMGSGLKALKPPSLLLPGPSKEDDTRLRHMMDLLGISQAHLQSHMMMHLPHGRHAATNPYPLPAPLPAPHLPPASPNSLPSSGNSRLAAAPVAASEQHSWHASQHTQGTATGPFGSSSRNDKISPNGVVGMSAAGPGNSSSRSDSNSPAILDRPSYIPRPSQQHSMAAAGSGSSSSGSPGTSLPFNAHAVPSNQPHPQAQHQHHGQHIPIISPVSHSPAEQQQAQQDQHLEPAASSILDMHDSPLGSAAGSTAQPALPSSDDASSTSSASATGSNSSSSVAGKQRGTAAPTAPAVSQLFYIQAQHEASRGLRVSVYTEDDMRASPASSEPFDVFCDATYAGQRLSFTFVARKEFDTVFLGATTKAEVDRRGAQIPCFGWRSCATSNTGHASGILNNVVPVHRPSPVASGNSSSGILQPSGSAGQPPAAGLWSASNGSSGGGAQQRNVQPLWKKGDSVELILTLPSPAGSSQRGSAASTSMGMGMGSSSQQVLASIGLTDASASSTTTTSSSSGGIAPFSTLHGIAGGSLSAKGSNGRAGATNSTGSSSGSSGSSLTLKVNGRVVDMIKNLPGRSAKAWTWYVGLWTGGDMSTAVFARDSYAIYWGDYVVKRYL